MKKFLTIFCLSLGAFGLMVGLTPMSAFAVDQATKTAKVDVNNATEEELEEIPGVGETYAKKIIDGRPYKTEADLIKAGIPQKTIDKMKDSIKFGKVKAVKVTSKTAETNPEEKTAKVDVNSATEEELEELPGVGKTYAKRIIDGRPYKTEDDLVKAGIPQKAIDKMKDSIKFGKAVKAHKETEAKSTSKTAEKNPDEETAKTPPQKGMVWVNTETKVYHKEGDRWYGKTAKGEFMTEKDAIKFGAHLSKQD